MEGAPVHIYKLTVEAGRLAAAVQLAPGCPRRTDARLAALARDRFPELAFHTCINGRGPTFASVMDDTPLPHLLEHLIINAQAADPRTAPRQRFVGTTRWTDEPAGRARVEVNFYDDLVALRAAKDALAALNAILARYAASEGVADDGSSGIRPIG